MMKDKIIVALDTQDEKLMQKWINDFKNEVSFVKVGMEAYYTFGNNLIHQLKEFNFKIFLDLKLHDIPNTVGNACRTLAKLDIDILNVHAAGGLEMMQRAAEGFKYHSKGQLIGVTHLTSTNQEQLNNELNIAGSLEDAVLHYARMVKTAGLDGVVCSAHEIKVIKDNIEKFITVTPGIRPEGSKAQDQKRIMTPAMAHALKTDYMVIGRPITQSEDPLESYYEILKELK